MSDFFHSKSSPLYDFVADVAKFSLNNNNNNPEDIAKKYLDFNSVFSSEPVKSKSKSKVKESENRWKSRDEYLELLNSGNINLCSYICVRGENKGKICCSYVENPNEDPSLNKCLKCSANKTSSKKVFCSKPTSTINLNKTQDIEDFVKRQTDCFASICNINTSDNFLFCINEGFKGLVIDINSNNCCIGKLTDSYGNNLEITNRYNLLDNWLDDLVELNTDEINFILSKKINYNFRN